MSNAILGTRKKRGRPKVGATQVQVRIDPALLSALDAFISGQPDAPSRPEAIRRLIADHPVLQEFLSNE